MTERFLKFIPSDEAFWLMENKPNAFRLLTYIANTARRYNGGPDGLIIGQCHLQHWSKYKLTEREYRTAKDILVQRKQIIIIETCRTRQKSTTGATTGSTLVQLLSSTIYDINSETTDDRKDDRPTTDRRQTRKNKNEEDKKEELPIIPSFSKIKVRDHVELTEKEHQTLIAKHGADMVNLMLDKLDSYKGSTGNEYKSDYHTMKDGGWVVTQVKKDIQFSKTPVENSLKYAEKLCNEFPEHKNGRGWRCFLHTDEKKDQRGLIFVNETGYQKEFFVALSDGNFHRRCEEFIKNKNMREK
jgi:hypothetical protein